MHAFIDFETYSELDLADVGAYRYVEHPSTTPLLLSWDIGDGAQVTDLTQEPFPPQLVALVAAGGKVTAHGQFDRIVWNRFCATRIAPEQYDDTTARAREIALPGKLKQLCQVLNLKSQKLEDDLLFCKPSKGRRLTAADKPERWAAFVEYSRVDTVTLRELDARLPQLSERELAAYRLDMAMNDRGVPVDVAAVRRLASLSASVIARLNQLCREASGGRVETIDKLPAMKAWMGVDSITQTNLAELQRSPRLTPAMKQVLKYRALGAKASNKKLQAILDSVSADGRCRGVLQFCGAHTRRWSGRLMQPQNFPRECFTADEVEAVLALDYPALVAAHKDPLAAISKCLRGMLQGPFTGADYNAIEARVLCWLADQQDVLEIFRRADALPAGAPKTKENDPYLMMAAEIPGLDRQGGKTIVLGSGYVLGGAKCAADLTAKGIPTTVEQGRQYIATYRRKFNRVVSLWERLMDAATAAATGEVAGRHWVSHRKVGFQKIGKDLHVILPNRNTLVYYDIRRERVPAPWDPKQKIWSLVYSDRQRNNKREFLGPSQLTNNICQAIAREVMLEGMLNLGVPLVLTVHDEVLAEGTHDLEQFQAQLTRMPEWAAGLPLRAEAKHMVRYGK